MPAPERVSLDVIKAALERWTGNVTAAAEDVGIHPNNLRKRLEAARVDPDAYRPPKRPEPPDSPVPTVRRRPPRLRILPRHVEELSEARLDVLARYRVETDEQLLLDQFLDEQLAAWIVAKLGSSGA
jgi:hypothetical protein